METDTNGTAGSCVYWTRRRGSQMLYPQVPMDEHPRISVWIDQDLCTGDGICTDHAPEVFTILEDGIAYCLEGPKVFNDPGGSHELAFVPASSEAGVIAAAAECPGECIFIEVSESYEALNAGEDPDRVSVG